MSAYFFEANLISGLGADYTLSEATSRHCTTVLRMQAGELIYLVNGQGLLAQAEIIKPHKDKTQVRIVHSTLIPARTPKLVVAVAFTKNRSRVEWLVEKLTEIGCDVIIPLNSKRSERDKLNADRLRQIMAAAMIQSKQSYMPMLTEPMEPHKAIDWYNKELGGQIFIAHCVEDEKVKFSESMKEGNTMVMIGPEGDFTPEEIEQSLHMGAQAITLGPNRLRTETAAIYACTVFNQYYYG